MICEKIIVTFLALSLGLNGYLLAKIVTPQMNMKAYGTYLAVVEIIYLCLVFFTDIIV